MPRGARGGAFFPMDLSPMGACTRRATFTRSRRRRPLSIRRIRMCARTAGAGRRKAPRQGRGTIWPASCRRRHRGEGNSAGHSAPTPHPARRRSPRTPWPRPGSLFGMVSPAAASLFSVQPPDGPVATCARRGLGSPRRAFFWVFHVRVTPRRQAAKVFQPDEPSNMGGARKRKSITTAQPVRCRRLCGLAARRETEMATLIAFCTEDTA